ncbi:MAG: hypothetical protein A2821_00835 [Candidatus Magasanikbacteria bacterium RIFCSPHIGHO2_01_FULL_41_23]|uniref:GH10 domain-containing protein n=1 Tax=Candidatus Magasanikbacteria bacterium RIFCSPLOWO2_01_FULL_40_15 TaxID=1798686 RepID=A0A1F6N0M4_9BACT|nr:MAG: hypothetical protein A2821_00835 [Candidatus Magasanikbacteria bacterium RIFCSPHIGHO2_01_FULL_41_23]OGH74720.1 MAG: hypothetical protein A3F22_02190 [Candidatus Magasanikbacteria bacterium RIFCSPHIGHO2_12_FULL_41_16]OGH77434.1 MAG: hypothetical protein A2983_01890 [Candidatus Magasanikbacteria bacterium RIFCSPLOWO2_01_FULL_40_15]
MIRNIFLVIAIIVFSGYACLLFLSLKIYPVEFGLSFNHNHAASLGLDWKKIYRDMLDDLQPKYIRVAAMWSEVEAEQGKFNFDNVDFLLDEASKRGVKVTLVVGQKTPRWPECHVPNWYKTVSDKEKFLQEYVRQVVERYREHAALEIWQVENEPFIRFAFGDCADFDESLVSKEIALVKALDPHHKIMVTDSGELSTWRQAINSADLFGTTIYRVVRTPSGFYFYYDWLPASFYRLKAQIYGRNLSEVFVAELQAEPWFTDSNPENTAIAEQEKSMNPRRLQKHLDYVRHIGSPRAYLWGVEWWAFMKEKRGDARYWDLVKNQLK